MSALDSSVLSERVAAVERHLGRVAEKLPQRAADFVASTDASDAVVLHPRLAVQLVIDLGTAL